MFEVLSNHPHPLCVVSVCLDNLQSICVLVFSSGVPRCQCVGSICHQIYAKRDFQSAVVSAEVPSVCHGGRGGAEQPCSVSLILFWSLYFPLIHEWPVWGMPQTIKKAAALNKRRMAVLKTVATYRDGIGAEDKSASSLTVFVLYFALAATPSCSKIYF